MPTCREIEANDSRALVLRLELVFVLDVPALSSLDIRNPATPEQAVRNFLVSQRTASHARLAVSSGVDGDDDFHRPFELAGVFLVEHVLIAPARRRIALLQEQFDVRLLVRRDAAGVDDNLGVIPHDPGRGPVSVSLG